jgi:hypothetical protein
LGRNFLQHKRTKHRATCIHETQETKRCFVLVSIAFFLVLENSSVSKIDTIYGYKAVKKKLVVTSELDGKRCTF